MRSRAVALLVLPVLLVLLVGGAAAVWVRTDVPLPGELPGEQAVVVQWADGTELARLGTARVHVPLSQVSTAAQHAVLAAEDRGFHDGAGLSATGVLRALWVNVRGGEVRQGGSTITQQYARAAALSSERTWNRKLREAAIAVKLAATRSREEVLEGYLNTVYFGRGAHGIEAAARAFFGVPAADLTAAQGAVLAAQLRSPRAYDPDLAPDRARERWRYVVDGMAAQGWLEQPPETVAYPDVLPRRPAEDRLGGPTGYLVAAALDELARTGLPGTERGGVVLRTTLDPAAQAAAVRAVEGLGPVPDGVYAALVAVEPGTGRVVASYGGPDYLARPFDAVRQGAAQAGSSFKPYVLAAALSRGVSLREAFDGASPQRFGDYLVRNAGGGSYGRLDLVDATARSVNTVFVPLGKRAGLRHVARTAAALGVTADMSRERDSSALSLGVTAVRPLDQAGAYAALAAGGTRAVPHVLAEVAELDGDVLWTADPARTQAVAPEVAADVLHALQAVVQRGTGRAARVPGRSVAGKTGTTDGAAAAWFVGATPQLATAVALYSDRPDVSLPPMGGFREVAGGTLPARVFSRFTAEALAGQPVLAFPPRADVGRAPTGRPAPGPTLPPLPPRSDAPSATLATQ